MYELYRFVGVLRIETMRFSSSFKGLKKDVSDDQFHLFNPTTGFSHVKRMIIYIQTLHFEFHSNNSMFEHLSPREMYFAGCPQ